MKRYQSHKIVEAARIADFHVDTEGTYTVVFEDGSDTVLIPELGDRILQMAIDAGTIVAGGWLVQYPDSDDYTSWSPNQPFEDGYDLVQPSSGKSKIAGYRELNEPELDNINAVKDLGLVIGDLVDDLRLNQNADQRWCSIGQTHLQQGLMALTRAIAKPDFF